jgi:hypothetical protein
VDKIAHAGHAGGEVEMPTDLLASLLMERASAPAPKRPDPYRVPAKIYAVMVLTSLLTFATLTTGYQLLFSHQVFA